MVFQTNHTFLKIKSWNHKDLFIYLFIYFEDMVHSLGQLKTHYVGTGLELPTLIPPPFKH